MGQISPVQRGVGGPLILILALALGACASTGPDQIDLMPAPAVYEGGVVDPFTDVDPVQDLPSEVFYATTRTPAGPDDEEDYYRNERSALLRLGVTRIRHGEDGITWEEARRISLLKNRTEGYPLYLGSVEEYGPLDSSVTEFTDPTQLPRDRHAPAARFAAKINEKLAHSEQKDIFIYVSGYNVTFENPPLVSAELWHFLGYEGAFIAFSWPSTPRTFAYLGDLETSAGTARYLRILLQYLAEETDVRRIHIVGYSAGTRMVAGALYQLALMEDRKNGRDVATSPPLGQVILVGSDIDRQVFGVYLADGILDVVDHLSIYVSEKDPVLGFSRSLFSRRERLGQMWKPGELPPTVKDYLFDTDKLSIINVTEAEGTTGKGQGHGYFRSSPWASSDVLVTLRYNLPPGTRGLMRSGDSPIWRFPGDYVQRLRQTLQRVNPDVYGEPRPPSVPGGAGAQPAAETGGGE